MNKSLVSVIIPVFRVEDYLNRCVESIVNQTYDNLEIILVDDGSDDNCPHMCDEWAKKDNRIKVVHKSNGGLSDARNAGMKVMHGEFVYFLDSDDYIVKDAIERMVTVMLDKNADAVAFGYSKISEKNDIISKFEFEDFKYDFNNQKDKHQFIYKKLLLYKLAWEAWNRIYRTKIIKDNNLCFEPNRDIFAEDMCFNLYYTLCSNNIVSMSDNLHYYLIRDNSIMGKQKDLPMNQIIELSKRVCSFADKLGFDYIISKKIYISTSILGMKMIKFDESEYEKYANIINDKVYCEQLTNKCYSLLIFMKIWGIRQGSINYAKCKKFIKVLKRADKK